MKALITATAVMAMIATQAQAQPPRFCAPRESVVGRLASQYGESRQSIGMGERGMVIETFASSDTGTWTITMTSPVGITCLVASGQSWEHLAEALPPKGDEL